MNTPDTPRPVLIAPHEVVVATKAVMGGIDLDPYTTTKSNLAIGAARFFDREEMELDDIIAEDWSSNLQQRVFLACLASAGIKVSRRLLLKLLRDYQRNIVSQAIVWVGVHETLTQVPWIWDFPVCIPYRRLRSRYWDSELESFRKIQPASWSFAAFLPPCDSARETAHALSAFHHNFTPLGRVIMNQFAGDDDWKKGYKGLIRRDYNFRA